MQRFRETGHLVFKSISAPSRGIPKQKKGNSNHTLQRRFDKHRTLVPNNSFRKPAQYLRSTGELVTSIRFDRGRKGTSQFICGQQDVLAYVQPEEVQLLISPPTMAPGNRMQENVLSFEAVSSKNSAHTII